jgi:hypothetical protein
VTSEDSDHGTSATGAAVVGTPVAVAAVFAGLSVAVVAGVELPTFAAAAVVQAGAVVAEGVYGSHNTAPK